MEPHARTMFEKIWSRHVVAEGPGGHVLLYIDRHLLHEGSTRAFGRLQNSGRRVRRPDLTFATADHYVLTSPGSPARDEEIRAMVASLGQHTAAQGIVYFGVDDPRRGIVHVIGPEQGLTLPGITLVCGDSHTATHGAFGALAFGIGSTEVEHVMTTQTLWQRKPQVMRITVEGRLALGVTAKDVILAIIARIGAGGGVGHVIEYAGSTIRAMTMDERMSVCNMSIEAGARARFDRHVADRHALVHGHGADRRARVLDDVPHAAAGADARDDRQDHVLGRDAERQTALDRDAHDLGLPLPERLRGHHVLDLGRADAEGERAERSVGRRVRVATDERDAGQRQPLLRPDDVHDPAPRVVDAEVHD